MQDNDNSLLTTQPKPHYWPSLIWLFPFTALILAFYLVYENYSQSGIDIVVYFDDASGIVANKTIVKFRGIRVGLVKSLQILDESNAIAATIDIDYSMHSYLTDQLSFWLVKPKVSLNGISGLDTLLSGPYIQVNLHSSESSESPGNPTRQFKARLDPPKSETPKDFSVYKLAAQDTAGINPGAIIYHRKLEVGIVHDVELNENNRVIEITLAINPQYQHLVKRGSRFWSVSGIKTEASLQGVKFEAQGLAALLVGGIAFNSPSHSPPADQYSTFRLYKSIEQSIESLELTLTFDKKSKVSEGTSIFYQAQKVGELVHLYWSDDLQYLHGVAKLSSQLAPLIRTHTQFWLDMPAINLNEIDLGSLLQGPVIRFLPGKGEQVTEFLVLKKPPHIVLADGGQQFYLHSPESHGIKPGAKVYFRQYPIGHIEWIRWQQQQQLFEFDIHIQPEFTHLVTEYSLFHVNSQLSFSADFNHFDVNIPSVEQLLNTGISLYVGDDNSYTHTDSTKLYSSLQAALTSQYQHYPVFTLYSPEFLAPSIGSPIYYQQFKIGQVIANTLDTKGQHTQTIIQVEPQRHALIREDTLFWQKQAISIDASFTNIKIKAAPLEALLMGGIQISSPNYVAPKAQSTQKFTLFNSESSAQQQQYTTITLFAEQDTALAVGQPVQYYQHKVGEVISIELMADLQQLKIEIQLSTEFEQHFTTAGTEYWLVQPKLSLFEIKHPKTLLSGEYIAVDFVDTNNRQPQYTFQLLDQRRRQPSIKNSLLIHLVSDELPSIVLNSPIIYRGLPIGEVVDYWLDQHLTQTITQIAIFPQYRSLITVGSQFWQLSGLQVKAGLFSGVQIQTQSLQTLLQGGIGLATDQSTSPAEALSQFTLHSEAKANWLDWQITP